MANSSAPPASATSEDLEMLRKRLSEVSIDFEEDKKERKKVIAKQGKELETFYSEIDTMRGSDRKLRHRVRQLENELELSIKKLNIINKSKGIRPVRVP